MGSKGSLVTRRCECKLTRFAHRKILFELFRVYKSSQITGKRFFSVIAITSGLTYERVVRSILLC